MNDLLIDIKQAQDFLYNFDPDLNITFQLFDDTKTSIDARRFTGHFTAKLDDDNCIKYLTEANKAGCGVYFTINATDGKGRSEKNITHIRTLAIDLDGAPLEPVTRCEISPHYIIESSPGKYQCYWLVDPISISDFESFDEAKHKFATWQVAMARLFHSDESIKDLPRVLRVPGFYHRKNAPFQTKIIEDNSGLPYKLSDVVKRLSLDEVIKSVATELKQPLHDISNQLRIKHGDRHLTLLRYACKYAHTYRLSQQEVWYVLQGLNNDCCETPIPESDLRRINIQAARYAEEERQQVEQVDISALLEKHRVVTENPADLIPEFLFRPPGLVGEVFDYMMACSIKQQPELCLAAAFAACGALFGRKVRTETNLRTNLYFLSLIETGGGKDWPRQAIKKLFTAAEALNRASVESVTSDSAVVNAICDCPSQVLLFDEFGRFLQATTSRNAGTHEIGIPTVLMKLFSSANNRFNAKTYADKKLNKIVEQPNACMLATSVESNFYKNITKEAVDDGLLNRIIFMKATDPDPAMRDIQSFDPPPELVAKFKEWEAMPYRLDGGNLANAENSNAAPPMPRMVPFAEGAKEVFKEMESGLREFRKELRKEGLSGLFSRCYENSIKVALVLACGRNRMLPQISINDAEYATTLVLTTTKVLLSEVRKKVSDNRVEANYQAVLMAIRDAGASGITQKELGDKLRKKGVDKRQRDEILKELVSTGSIHEDKDESTSKKGTMRYYFLRG